MKHLKKILCAVLALAMALSLAACGKSGGDNEVKKQYLRVSAGPSGGFNYTLFAGIADQVNKAYPGYYDIQIDISTGSSENARNVMLNEAAFGMVGLDIVKDAYDATGEFDGMQSGQINHVISGPAAVIHVLTLESSGINTIEDLVGKKVGVGKGVMANYLPIIFKALNLPTDTTEMKALSITDICNGLSDGTIDAGLYATPYPTASISDLSMSSKIKLIPIPADTVEKVAAEYPFFYTDTIPAGSYSGVDYDTPTMSRRSAIMTNPNVDEDVVYNFLKTIIEQNDALVQVHADAASLSLENALSGLQTPLHPGAEKYYKEVGLIK